MFACFECIGFDVVLHLGKLFTDANNGKKAVQTRHALNLDATLLLYIVFLSHLKRTRTYSPSLSAQILTAQFRQMEQELAEAVKLREVERQQWAEQASRADAELAGLRASLEALEKERLEVARQESELASLIEAERASHEALEKEKMEVARLEGELAVMKEADLAAAQASERHRTEIARLEGELASVREAESAAVHARQDASEREKSEVEKLEKELASLREEQEAMQKKGEILGEIWRHLCSLAEENVPEEIPVPADLSHLLDTVRSIEAQMTRLKDECGASEEQCAQLTHSMEALQGMSAHLGICLWDSVN